MLRARRLEKLKSLGLVAPDVLPYPKDKDLWEELDGEAKSKSARAMEVYAGMVDRMDWNIGRVIAHLKESGEYDNTIIMFMSDNGAEGASYEAAPILGDKILEHLAKYYDNSLENIGRKNSFVWYGSHWAQAATAPGRLFKMFSTEGGCRVPLIVKTPVQGGKDNSASLISDAYCTVMDVVPTILEWAGIQHPGKTYKGRPIARLRGHSWKSFLESAAAEPNTSMVRGSIHDPHYVTGFEVAGSGALRRGDYKITFVPHPRGLQKWEMFNIRLDPGETNDLRETQPELFSELLALWEEYRKDVGVVGLAGEYTRPTPGSVAVVDEFSDPYAWIKYIGRPERTPPQLKGIVPTNVR